MIRTTRVDVMPFSRVDEAFAFDEGEGEGEGDRTLAWWRDAHRRFFRREAASEGFVFHEDLDVVLERFEVVWPPELVDTFCGGV